MKLITFGCSWLYGDELIPNTPEFRNGNNLGGIVYKNHKDIFSDYLNYSGNGASNERIILQVTEYLNSSNYSSDDFLLIGLSSPLRRLDYINKLKIPLTIPHWHEMHLNKMKDDSGFVDWFKLDTIYNNNTRNELKRYFINLFSLKGLIYNNNYLVFQSIDSPNDLYRKVDYNEWMDVPVYFYDKSKNTEEVEYSKLIFNREFINTQLKNNTNINQNWINFDTSWEDYLRSFNDNDTFYASHVKNHPSKLGSELFYDRFVKKYINKLK